jgi:hypothetical protein
MDTTVEQIKEAKKKTESEINKIVTDFANQFKLYNMSVDVRVTQMFSELQGRIGVMVNTEIKVNL